MSELRANANFEQIPTRLTIEQHNELVEQAIAETEARIAERLKFIEKDAENYRPEDSVHRLQAYVYWVSKLIQEPQSDSVNEIPVALDKAQKIRHEINKRDSVNDGGIFMQCGCEDCEIEREHGSTPHQRTKGR